MKKIAVTIILLALCTVGSFAQNSKLEAEVLKLSMDKWNWMAEKNVDQLKELFDDKAKFVHMSGTWKTPEELEIIESGSIWYKEAKVKDTAIEISGKTAIVWNRITLVAHVRGNDVSTEFTVTEVYQKQKKNWKMLALTFSSVRDTHEIRK
ncbi:nuclear transport factor 2 family protein [Jiulongibacter sediminis]|jgi:ketosteroid isomerase-like protein|uniref:nuclear transport factor 2 family protein n=1 Tax=Jiulongibacter sediminis TaxID=1605367 RepID=UPI0026EBE411|nr:nuclear transport factor 2 family protein [Jiulongibacter sediminis]